MSISYVNAARVCFLKVLSSAVLLWMIAVSVGQAHEIEVSIADIRATEDAVTFDMRANLESFVAGIDLSSVANTDEAEETGRYDTLRAMPPDTLTAAFRAFWPEMAGLITLTADGADLLPELVQVDVPEVGNVEDPRPSTFAFRAALPEGAQVLQVGWDARFGTLVLRQMDVTDPYDGFLQDGALSAPFPLAGGTQASSWQTFVDYIPVGFDHIVPKGLDHILFVLGLFFLAARIGPLVLQISLFTVAHTITLALAALGYTRGIELWFESTLGIAFIDVVEPLIALSIAYVAIENIFARGINLWRPFVIFLFGLLHGLGFASVLAEFGLPDQTFLAALIGFNVGVELGQLAVIAAMFLFVWQALRIDGGRFEVPQGLALYAILFGIGGTLLFLNAQEFATLTASPLAVLDAPVLLLGLMISLMAILCLLSVALRDWVDAFRRLVAVPASAVIAAIGLYWFIDRSLGALTGA